MNLLKKHTDKNIPIFEVEYSIDSVLYKSREDYDLKEKYKETRNLLLKYLKITKYSDNENYDIDLIRYYDIDQNGQREKRMGYLKMLSDAKISEAKLDIFVQKGCLNDLRYFDRIVFMIDAFFLDIEDVLYNLSQEKVIPIIDPSIKLKNIGSKDYRFGTYCENQRDSFIDRLGRQKTI